MKAMSPEPGVLLLDGAAALYLARTGLPTEPIKDKRAPWAEHRAAIQGRDRDARVKKLLKAVEEYAAFIDET